MASILDRAIEEMAEEVIEQIENPLKMRLLDYKDVVINHWSKNLTDDYQVFDPIRGVVEPDLEEIVSDHELYSEEILNELKEVMIEKFTQLTKSLGG